MDSQRAVKPLERNPRADVREGWGPLGHHIAVPEPVFVQETETVARARFGDALDRLTPETQAAIEEEVSDPIYWTARPNYHAQACPACSEPSLSAEAPTQ